jgi:hypothetical protein
MPNPYNNYDGYLTKEHDMTCQKCNGLLISERILEFYTHTDRWKCINVDGLARRTNMPRALWRKR